MLNKLKWAFRHAAGNRKGRHYTIDTRDNQREQHKAIVRLLSTGNVNLQRGRYITRNMIEQKRERLLGSK